MRKFLSTSIERACNPGAKRAKKKKKPRVQRVRVPTELPFLHAPRRWLGMLEQADLQIIRSSGMFEKRKQPYYSCSLQRVGGPGGRGKVTRMSNYLCHAENNFVITEAGNEEGGGRREQKKNDQWKRELVFFPLNTRRNLGKGSLPKKKKKIFFYYYSLTK